MAGAYARGAGALAARAVNSTRYAMFAANFVEYFFCWISTSVLCVLKSLPDAILCIVAIHNVEQTLISFSGLCDSCCLTLRR
jgi:hypothetical protein